MSVIKFELKEEHIKLLSQLDWGIYNNIISGVKSDDDGQLPPFGDPSIYDAMDIILNGQRSTFDPLSDNRNDYSDEQKEYFDKLYSELPIALDIILYTKQFKPGLYKTKYHIKNWILV